MTPTPKLDDAAIAASLQYHAHAVAVTFLEAEDFRGDLAAILAARIAVNPASVSVVEYHILSGGRDGAAWVDVVYGRGKRLGA